MKATFEITEDTVTDGLTQLQERVAEEMEYILREMSYDATGRFEEEDAPIPKRMSTEFNPYLFTTGQEDEHRFYDITDRRATISILYSGKDLDEDIGYSEARRWWEFSENFDPTSALERDYAYYQETGRDSVATPTDARHKFAIEFGMRDAARPMRDTLKRQMARVLNIL